MSTAIYVCYDFCQWEWKKQDFSNIDGCFLDGYECWSIYLILFPDVDNNLCLFYGFCQWKWKNRTFLTLMDVSRSIYLMLLLLFVQVHARGECYDPGIGNRITCLLLDQSASRLYLLLDKSEARLHMVFPITTQFALGISYITNMHCD
jgi:hypothetical protein